MFGPMHVISSLLRFETIQGFLSFFFFTHTHKNIRTKEKKICVVMRSLLFIKISRRPESCI